MRRSLSRLLQNFVENNPKSFTSPPSTSRPRDNPPEAIRADQDPFVEVALKRAFTASIQGSNFVSEPFALGKDNRPALVMSVPLLRGRPVHRHVGLGGFDRPLLARLQDASVRDRTVYIVDVHGHIVAHAGHARMVPGRDVTSTSPLVKHFKELPQELRATETMQFREVARKTACARSK